MTSLKHEFEVGKNMLKKKCPVCRQHFCLKEKIILCPIQEPAGDYFINALAIPIHKDCYYKEKDDN